jgi:hypothetical protein
MSGPDYPIRGLLRYDRIDERETACRVTMPDGSSSIQELIPYDGPRVDWCAELGIPYMDEPEKLETMATARGFSARGFSCILLDESPTRFPGAWRHRVREITYRAGDHYLLTLSHTGLVIGSVGNIRLGVPGEVDGVEGDFLMAQARLYDSALADRAWNGIMLSLFAMVCPIIARTPTAPVGTGELVEVALGDVGGCPGARITKLLKDTSFGTLEMTTTRVPIDELPPEVQRALGRTS